MTGPDGKPVGPFDQFAGSRANFLAHLIAMRDRLPQTTVLRREAPDVAVAIYASHVEAPGGARSRLI